MHHSTSTPINHISFFLCIFCRIPVVLESRSSQRGVGGGGSQPLHPPPRSAPASLLEINNTKAKNILCCCACRHPSFNPVRFKEHLESILSQLTRENKNIFIIDDFNINLLTCESHPESNDFILMLNSFFLPYILQPARITERSVTLIIFLQILIL